MTTSVVTTPGAQIMYPSPRLRRLALGLLALFTTLGVAAAQPASPDFTDDRALPAGKRGERIRELIDTVNSGDPARIEQLAKSFGGEFAKIPVAEHVEQIGNMNAASQGFELYGVRSYPSQPRPDREVVVVRNRLTEAWQAFVVVFDDSPEARITGIQFAPARPPKDQPPLPPLTLDQAKAEIDAFLDRLTNAEAFSGTVLIGRNGQVLYTAARGIAERNHDVPVRLDTKFNLGSMDKMFTAVTVASLVDDGTLRFEDPVSKYLGGKGWTKADLSKVTIANLLSHTSGLGSYFNREYQRTARQLLRTVDDYKPLVAEETLAFEPGTKWQYSNTGFLLAGAVIEAATGRDYFDVVRERVYRKAGMTGSDSYDIDLVVPHLAIGYSREKTAAGTRWRANTFEHVIRGGPAGGGYSTAQDLFAFAEVMRNDKLVSAATRNRLWSPKPELQSPQYGFGFGVSTDPLGRAVGHSGGFPGISSSLRMYPDSGWTVVVLSNVDMGAMPVEERVQQTLARVR
jgi:CubicO group peptidase (beta-lactamase class C family)